MLLHHAPAPQPQADANSARIGVMTPRATATTPLSCATICNRPPASCSSSNPPPAMPNCDASRADRQQARHGPLRGAPRRRRAVRRQLAALLAHPPRSARDFMTGDISGYPSASEADLAFCNLIVFYTDDPEQVVRIVQHSGMNRDKWSRADYAQRTIKMAFEGRRNRYDPNYRSNGQSHHEHNGHVRNGEIDGHDTAGLVCLTDVGNGKRFAADHHAIVRYCHPWKKWLIWDGIRSCALTKRKTFRSCSGNREHSQFFANR